MIATLVHEDGREDLGFVHDAVVDPRAEMVALLGLDHALRRDSGDRVDLLAHDVVPGLATCDEGRRLLYAQRFGRYDQPHPDLRAFFVEDGTSRGVDVGRHTLDRIVGMTPDCARALVVLRHGGWPVLAVADLDGRAGIRALSNLGLTGRGARPAGFVPPPESAQDVVWSDTDTLRYTSDAEVVELDLAAAVELPDPTEARIPRRGSPNLDRYRLPVDPAAAWEVTAFFDLGGAGDWSCGDGTFAGHRGTDIAPTGAGAHDDELEVVAAADGVVVHAHDGERDGCTTGNCFTGAGFGNHVVLRHGDGKHTVYAHLRRFSVSVETGQTVGCGEPLGAVGSSGRATGPHLHFEVRNDAGHHTADDPYTGPCGGPVTYWVEQGERGALPGSTCESLE
jgi:hypothetical protein